MTVIFGDTRMPERFWEKLTINARGCWEMGKKPNAYSIFWFEGTTHGAHRLAWQRLVGPIDDGLHMDHVCRNKPCCNPNHLEPVTPAVNSQRGFTPVEGIAKRTHCSNGHELTPENEIDSRVPYRHCKTCRIDWITAKVMREIDEDDWTWYSDE
jgi:hypothetical protein